MEVTLMENKTIGAFIAVLRKAKGLTQKQLAEMLNVSDKAVSRWERDECAPDLSVIPVLAEIFGVTADELLRGQRKAVDEPETKYEVQRTDKQLQRIISETVTNFRIRSTITVGVAVIGFIAAIICNIFNRANLGFGIACIFYVCAFVCQIIFLILARQSLSGDETLSERAADAKATVFKTAMLVISFVITLIAATLPLITLIQDAFLGLGPNSWLSYGMVYVLVALADCLVLVWIANIRFGYAKAPDMKTPRNKLRLRTALILAAVLIVTLVFHSNLYSFLYSNTHLYYPGTRWDNWEDLKEFLETPVASNGESLTLVSCTQQSGDSEYCEYVDDDGYTYYLQNLKDVLVYEQDMETPRYSYIHRNHSVYMFSYENEQEHFPIHTYTKEEYGRAGQRLLLINLYISSVYVLEIIAAIILYRRKSKKLTQPA